MAARLSQSPSSALRRPEMPPEVGLVPIGRAGMLCSEIVAMARSGVPWSENMVYSTCTCCRKPAKAIPVPHWKVTVGGCGVCWSYACGGTQVQPSSVLTASGTAAWPPPRVSKSSKSSFAVSTSGPVPTNWGRGALAGALVGWAFQCEVLVTWSVDGLNWHCRAEPSDPCRAARWRLSALTGSSLVPGEALVRELEGLDRDGVALRPGGEHRPAVTDRPGALERPGGHHRVVSVEEPDGGVAPDGPTLLLAEPGRELPAVGVDGPGELDVAVAEPPGQPGHGAVAAAFPPLQHLVLRVQAR